jgi:hypothetical protein
MDRAYYNIYQDGAGNKRTIEDASPTMSAQAIMDRLAAKDTFLNHISADEISFLLCHQSSRVGCDETCH